MLNHSYEKVYKNVSLEDFRVLGNGFSKNRFKRKKIRSIVYSTVVALFEYSEYVCSLKLVRLTWAS